MGLEKEVEEMVRKKKTLPFDLERNKRRTAELKSVRVAISQKESFGWPKGRYY